MGRSPLKNVSIGNLFYDEFTFEIAADHYKDYNNLIGMDVIENFNPRLDFDVFEVTGELHPICELRTAIDYAQTVRLLSLPELSITELPISSNPSEPEEQQLLHYFKITGAAELIKYKDGNIRLKLEPTPELDITTTLAKLEDNEVIEEIERKKGNDIEYITYKLKQL